MIPSPAPDSDSAAMNRALRWAFVALVLIAGAAFYFLTKAGQIPSKAGGGALPEVNASLAAEVPRATFHDVTTDAGIKFTHATGARGEKLLPETMGGGCAFVDFDDDGDQDIVLV